MAIDFEAVLEPVHNLFRDCGFVKNFTLKFI